ncbi:MAG: hypothetical protein JO287_08065 [Pseudonocardiales bacterium]|nr:hypothetical protein [Pseudonocardiales bacterium]
MKHVSPDQWAYVIVPFLVYGGLVAALSVLGWESSLRANLHRNYLVIFFKTISAGLERATGYPGWAMAGALSGLWSLGTAVVGLYWDVAWHIDLGRDKQLFTPPHTMIVIGLAGIVYSACIAVLFATLDDAPVGVRVPGLHIPYSAIPMAALGVGALVSFPLDALWHAAYGLDVTLWSPTHLMLVGGGGLATIPTWLMLVEGRPAGRTTLLGRGIVALALGAILVAVSCFEGEFDFGVPQFQVLYLPVLIAAAAAFALVVARAALGPWGAIKAVVAYLIVRGAVALIVWGPLHHTFPRFPLYLASAVVVEAVAAWVGTDNRLRYALASGVAIATVGVAGELAWVKLSGWGELPANDARVFLVVPAAALSAAVLGGALSRPVLGRPVLGRPTGSRRAVPAMAAGMAGVVLAGTLLALLPRNVGEVNATIRLIPAGQQATVAVELAPADAARRATAFGVVAWQGGGRVSAKLNEVGPGRYISSRPLPVTGDWKTMVGLQRGDEVMAAPVYLPADPEINASAFPALPERRAAFVRNTDLLLREQHAGPAWPSVVGYSGLAVMVAFWTGLMAFAAHRLSGAGTEPLVLAQPAVHAGASDP